MPPLQSGRLEEPDHLALLRIFKISRQAQPLPPHSQGKICSHKIRHRQAHPELKSLLVQTRKLVAK